MYDKLSFLKGLALGLAGKPLEFAPGKEPTVFFYGHVAKDGETPTHTFDGVDYVGMILPDIYKVYTPELQKEYPYALIWIDIHPSDLYDYRFIAINDIQYYQATSGWAVKTINLAGSNYQLEDNAWQIHSGVPWGVRLDDFIWSNFNVLNKDGTIYLPASDPIPIYE